MILYTKTPQDPEAQSVVNKQGCGERQRGIRIKVIVTLFHFQNHNSLFCSLSD